MDESRNLEIDDDDDDDNVEVEIGCESGDDSEDNVDDYEDEDDVSGENDVNEVQHQNAIQVAPNDMAPFEVPFMDRVRDQMDLPDRVIEMRGHVIGLALSPDHRYLYVNVRAWPKEYEILDW